MPKPYNPKRFTAFVEKPRSWRRDRYVALRWKIANDPNGRGVFTSQHMMDGGIYDGKRFDRGGDSHWCDFRFLSQAHARDGLVYTATVRTALMKAADWAEDYAWEKERETLTEEEHAAAYPRLEFITCGRGEYTLKSHDDPVFERLDGLSVWGLRARFLRDALAIVPPVSPSCEFKKHYKTGMGVWFVTGNDSVTIDNLAGLVEDFWVRGEIAYEDEAIDFSPNNPAQHAKLTEMINAQASSWERMDLRARGLLVEDEEEANKGAATEQKDGT